MIWMKVIQCAYLLRLWKSNVSGSQTWAWQLAYLSEKGKFWDDCQCSAPFMYFTRNKTQEYPCLFSPRPMPCCSLLALSASFCPWDWHPLLALTAQGWSTQCSAPVFGVISWKTWFCPGTYMDWKSPTAQADWGVRTGEWTMSQRNFI